METAAGGKTRGRVHETGRFCIPLAGAPLAQWVKHQPTDLVAPGLSPARSS